MFDNVAFWLFPRSVQEDDPQESTERMRAGVLTSRDMVVSER